MTSGWRSAERAAAARWWRSHLWRRAPAVLFHHAGAFAALLVAGALVSLAASSAPFVTTAAASAALKDKLAALAPLATGLQISNFSVSAEPSTALLRTDDRRRAAIARLGRRLRLEPPVFTVESQTPLIADTAEGSAQVLLLARSGVLAHVRQVASVPGDGVWIPDLTARSLGLRPGGTVRIDYEKAGSSRSLRVRIKGIYRALDRSIPSPYWANFLTEILPQGVDPPPPARYLLMPRRMLFALAQQLSAARRVRYRGRVFYVGNGFGLTTKAELAVDPHGLTLVQARRLQTRFATVRRALRSSLGEQLGCRGRRVLITSQGGTSVTCQVASSLSSAAALADTSAASISPGVSLLAGAGTAIALGVAAAAGFFLVQRRRGEAALLFARGESGVSYGARTALEILLPLGLGGGAGFLIALLLTGTFAPSGSIDAATVDSAAARGGAALAAAFLLVVVVACVVFARQFDSGRQRFRRLRLFPWELPLLALSLWLLVDVRSGGGLATDAKTGASHPTLAVFVFPLLLAAALAGLVTRGARLLLRRTAPSGASIVAFLFTRRLAAARGTLVVLAVVSAAAFAAYYYSVAVAASLSRGVDEKAYIAYGGDVQGVVSDTAAIPRAFAFPATRVDYAIQVATLASASGAYADVLAVDAGSIGSVIHWYSAWGPNPQAALARLRQPQHGALPVLIAGLARAGLSAVWLDGVRIPVVPVGRVRAFPGMAAGAPLLVVDRDTVIRLARSRHAFDPLGTPQTYVWANGPPAAVSRALEEPPLDATFVTTIDQFRQDPDVLLAKRIFAYMRLVALAAGVLVLIALVLYLQVRQRTQAIASALAARMGLSRRAEVVSLALELAAIAGFAALIGGATAVAATAPIVGHIDPLSADPPAPTLAVPVTAIVASAATLVLLAVCAGVLVSFAARRTDLSEALRVG